MLVAEVVSCVFYTDSDCMADIWTVSENCMEVKSIKSV